MTGLVRFTDPAGGHSVVCRSDKIAKTVEPWFPDAPADVVEAIAAGDWAYLDLQVEALADDEVDADTWGRLLVWPAIRESGQQWRSGDVRVSAYGMSRVNPSPAGATITVTTESETVSREVQSWGTVREMVAEVVLAARLSDLGRRSTDRQAADAAAEQARLRQRAATVAALDAGATVYRCAQVSGLTQPGVRKMLASSPQ